jgi:hypothetical protein
MELPRPTPSLRSTFPTSLSTSRTSCDRVTTTPTMPATPTTCVWTHCLPAGANSVGCKSAPSHNLFNPCTLCTGNLVAATTVATCNRGNCSVALVEASDLTAKFVVFIAITKVKIIVSYKACKCDSSVAIRLCRVAELQKVVRRAPDWYGIWNGSLKATYWNGAKNFNRIQYSLQFWRAYRYGGTPYSKVVRSTEQ